MPKPKTTATPQPATPDQLAAVTYCLSVCEPWAAMLVAGHKPIENRTWATAFRGRLAIHASSSTRHMTDEAVEFIEDLAGPGSQLERSLQNPDLFNYGCIVGVVDLFDCVEFDADAGEFDALPAVKQYGAWLASYEIPVDAWAEGPHCFMVRNAHQFTHPIPAKGALNIFRLTPELQAAVAAELARPPGTPEQYRGCYADKPADKPTKPATNSQ